MWCSLGQPRSPQGSLPPIRWIAHTCSGSGEDIGEGMQRSRCYSASKCQAVGHERRGEGRRRTMHQGARHRTPPFPRRSIGSGSALTSNGDPRPGQHEKTASRATELRSRKCGELTEGNRCRLVVVALETGGHQRWPGPWRSRMVSVSCGRAFATSLGGPKGSARSGWG